MIEVGRDDVRRLLAEPGTVLVDVLPASDYADEHLPGSVNIPLKELARRAPAELARDAAVIVYCHDSQCDLSPRAAWRLEHLGFTRVHDYVAGKMDWAAAGLPVEGRAASEPRIGAVAHRDVPRCATTDAVADVGQRLGDWELAVVVDEQEVVVGIVRADDATGDQTVGQVMSEGPSTYRPNVPVAELRERFDTHDISRALVTTAGGQLIGLVRRSDLGEDSPT
jgi:rhodanese-related sulfurtransferase